MESRLQRFLAGILCLSIGLSGISLAQDLSQNDERPEFPKIKVNRKIPSLKEKEKLEQAKPVETPKPVRTTKKPVAKPPAARVMPEPEPVRPPEEPVKAETAQPAEPELQIETQPAETVIEPEKALKPEKPVETTRQPEPAKPKTRTPVRKTIGKKADPVKAPEPEKAAEPEPEAKLQPAANPVKATEAASPVPKTKPQTVQRTRPAKPVKPKEKPVVKFPTEESPASVVEQAKTTTRAKQSAKSSETGMAKPSPQSRRSRKYQPPPSPQQVRLHEELLKHYDRAGRLGSQGKFEEAIAEYKRVLKINPGMADAYVGLAASYGNMNDWEAAMEASQTALRMKSGFLDWRNMIQAHYNLSTAYCVAGDYGRAKRHFRKVKKAKHPQARNLWAYLDKNCRPR